MLLEIGTSAGNCCGKGGKEFVNSMNTNPEETLKNFGNRC
jgi:hypothetical protein